MWSEKVNSPHLRGTPNRAGGQTPRRDVEKREVGGPESGTYFAWVLCDSHRGANDVLPPPLTVWSSLSSEGPQLSRPFCRLEEAKLKVSSKGQCQNSKARSARCQRLNSSLCAGQSEQNSRLSRSALHLDKLPGDSHVQESLEALTGMTVLCLPSS